MFKDHALIILTYTGTVHQDNALVLLTYTEKVQHKDHALIILTYTGKVQYKEGQCSDHTHIHMESAI